MIDRYFRNPIGFDFLVSTIAVILFTLGEHYNLYIPPSTNDLLSLTTDFSTLSLTSSGFILTILTVLITFKSSFSNNKLKELNDQSLFELFFTSNLYPITINIYKNCIKILILVSLIGFLIKILFSDYLYLILIFNIYALVIITLTLWRCLLVLSKIINMQEQ